MRNGTTNLRKKRHTLNHSRLISPRRMGEIRAPGVISIQGLVLLARHAEEPPNFVIGLHTGLSSPCRAANVSYEHAGRAVCPLCTFLGS